MSFTTNTQHPSQPIPGCSVYKRFVCACDDCVKLLDEKCTYFHGIMNEIDLESKSPTPMIYDSTKFEIEQHDLNAANGMVIRATHVYDGYAIDDIFADFGPETPRFTSLQLRKTNAFAYEHEKIEESKWVKRQQLTPTQLVFLPFLQYLTIEMENLSKNFACF